MTARPDRLRRDAGSPPSRSACLPFGDESKLIGHVHAIQAELGAHEVRAELDASSDHIKAKIASAESQRAEPLRRARNNLFRWRYFPPQIEES